MSEVLVHERAVRRKGPVVTFSGIDGSGKTSLALVAADELRRQGYRVRILRMYPYPPISTVKRLLNIFFPGIFRGEAENATHKRTKAIISRLRQLLFILDCLYNKHILQFFSHRGTAVVCDRYFYDSLVMLFYERACDEADFKRLAAGVPAPDAAFLLRAGDNVICARRKETTLEECRARSEAYLKLVDIGDFWIVDIDDGRKAQTEIRGILSYAGRRW